MRDSKTDNDKTALPLTRRGFLYTGAAAAAGTLVALPKRALADSNEISQIESLNESEHFPLGLASGDASSESAIIWCYYDGFFKTKLAIWPSDNEPGNDEPGNNIVYLDAGRSDGGYIHFHADALNAYTNYRYAFLEYDFSDRLISRSPIARFRTAPKEDQLIPITLGAVSCTYNTYEIPVLEQAGQRKDLDAFLLLGDTTYNDGAKTLHGYRKRWATSLSRLGYRMLRASTSVIATLDDHEVTNNFNPETLDPWQIAQAKRALFDNLPIRRNSQHDGRIWRSLKWGKTVEIFVLDCRTERLPSTRGSSADQYISVEQMEWLKDGLSRSESMFKVIMNSVPITDFPIPMEHDRWEGYPHQRTEILSYIDRTNIGGVIWVSGDFHFGSLGRVSKHGPGKDAIEVLAGPGAQIGNPLGWGVGLSSQFEWTTTRNNYITLHFSPAESTIDIHYHAAGEDPEMPAKSIETVHQRKLKLDMSSGLLK